MKKCITLILSFFLLTLLPGCITEEEHETVSLSVGDKCPDFTIQLNDGTTVSTSDLRGENSVIVLFNTTCKDCQAELPEIQKLYDKIRNDGLSIRVLCISWAESQQEIEEYWSAHNLSLPFSPQDDREIYNLFATSIIPRTYLISPSLIITSVWTDNPMPTAEEILARIKD